MALPGFSAEASLSGFSGHRTSLATAGTDPVVPQLRVQCYVKAIAQQQQCIRGGTPRLLCQALFVNDVERC